MILDFFFQFFLNENCKDYNKASKLSGTTLWLVNIVFELTDKYENDIKRCVQIIFIVFQL